MDFDEVLLANVIFRDMYDAEEQVREGQREVLQMRDPFTLTDMKFVKYFRVTKYLARKIIILVTPFMQQPSRRSAISIDRKVLTALRFFGMGSYQEITGTNSYTAVSQATVSRCITEVCNALIQPQILDQWVYFPQNIRQLQSLRNRFYLKYGLPGVVGVIDCTHVAIVRPWTNDPLHPEHIYVNRKGYHSINVQLICDENLRILNVNVRFPGSCHDSHIWRESAVSQVMEQVYQTNNENVFYLLGDSGYPLRPWLQTPLRAPIPETPEDAYNNVVLSVRSIIERCNGVLKNRFRCLLKHRVLHYKPDTAAKIIKACVVLHNMCIHHNVPDPEFDEEVINVDFGIILPENNMDRVIPARVNPDLDAGRRIQRQIIQTHFYN